MHTNRKRQMTTYQAADKSIGAYDAYIFASVGRSFDANRANALAAAAVVDCETAAHDRSINQFTQNHFRAQAEEFRAICA
jgi:hypothetical protein